VHAAQARRADGAAPQQLADEPPSWAVEDAGLSDAAEFPAPTNSLAEPADVA